MSVQPENATSETKRDAMSGGAPLADASVAVDLLDDHGEKPVEEFDDLHGGSGADQLGRSDDIDEYDSDVALFAAQGGPLLFGCRCDLASDVASEQVAHLLALAQTGDHRVETTLKFA